MPKTRKQEREYAREWYQRNIRKDLKLLKGARSG